MRRREQVEISGLRKPSEVFAYLECLSTNGLSQIYDNFNGSYMPNRDADNPTVLRMNVNITDAKTKEAIAASNISCRWYEIDKDGVSTEITNNIKYAISGVGNSELKIKYNLPGDQSGVSIKCVASFTDPNAPESSSRSIHASATLTTNISTVAALSLQYVTKDGDTTYECKNTILNPLTSPFSNADSWKRNICCQLFDGSVPIADHYDDKGASMMGNAFYFWYYKLGGDNDWSIITSEQDWFECTVYADGSMSKMATVDLSKVRDINLRCRAGFIPYGEESDYTDADGMLQPSKMKQDYLKKDYKMSVELPYIQTIKSLNVSGMFTDQSNLQDDDYQVIRRCQIVCGGSTINDMNIAYKDWYANSDAAVQSYRQSFENLFIVRWYKVNDDDTEELLGTGEFLAFNPKSIGWTDIDTPPHIEMEVEPRVMVGGAIGGMVRIQGSSDPTASVLLSQEKAKEIARKFRLCIVKNGEIVKTGARGRITMSTDGEDMAIDGSEGDVMVCTESPIDYLHGEYVSDGKTHQVIGVSLAPSDWNGIKSQRFQRFAMSPWETVNAKIFDDVRAQAHCICNKNVNGEYQTPIAFFEETIKKSGGGYPHQFVSGITSIQQAQAKNTNNTTNSPAMGLYYQFYEVWYTLVCSIAGTLDLTKKSLFGVGCTPSEPANATTWNDDAISADSGVKLIYTDGTEKYLAINANIKTSSSANGQMIIGGIAGSSWYGFIESGEDIRLLDAITKYGLTDKVGNKNNIFSYDDDGNLVCTSDGSINLSTGEGMVPAKRYYVVRNVPNFNGISDGEFTAVTNLYIRATCKSGVYIDSTDISGATCIFKFSLSCAFGYTMPLRGFFRQLSGLHYVPKMIDNKVSVDGYAAERPEDMQPLTNTTIYAPIGTDFNVLKGLKSFGSVYVGSFWASKADYNVGLLAHKSSGGNIHTHECAYTWRDGHCYGAGVNSLPANGYAAVNASVVGCNPSRARASGRSLFALDALTGSPDLYAGAWAFYPIRAKQAQDKAK